MKTKLKFLSFFFLFFLPLAVPAIERLSLLPPEATSYFHVSNTTNFWNKLQKSSVGKLLNDPAFQDFWSKPDENLLLEKIFSKESDAERMILREQFKMLDGEIIFGFQKQIEDPCMIVAITEENFNRSLDLDIKYNELKDLSFEQIRSTFQNVEMIQEITKKGTPQESSSWQAFLNGTLVCGRSKEWVERCIIQLQKEPVEEPKGNPECKLQISISNLIQTILRESKRKTEGSSQPFDLSAILNSSGLMGVERFSLRIELKDTEMQCDSNLVVFDLDKGIFTLLDNRPLEFPNVTFIPENISSLEMSRFNLLRFWKELPTILAPVIPAAQFGMVVATIQQQTGINLERDLFANIGNRWIGFTTSENSEQVSVIAIELKTPLAFKTGLETALSAPVLQEQVARVLEIEEFLDCVLYTIKSPTGKSTFAFGISGNNLFLSQPNGLRQVIRTQNNDDSANCSLENSPFIRGLLQYLPSNAFSFSALDMKKNMKNFVHQFNNPHILALMGKHWKWNGRSLKRPNFDQMPTSEHIASFFNIVYGYSERTDEGIHRQIVWKY